MKYLHPFVSHSAMTVSLVHWCPLHKQFNTLTHTHTHTPTHTHTMADTLIHCSTYTVHYTKHSYSPSRPGFSSAFIPKPRGMRNKSALLPLDKSSRRSRKRAVSRPPPGTTRRRTTRRAVSIQGQIRFSKYISIYLLPNYKIWRCLRRDRPISSTL